MTQQYTPHKWAEVIKAWADGKPIQYRKDRLDAWRDWAFGGTPNVNSDIFIWRVKPNTIRYRRYLYQPMDPTMGPQLSVVHEITGFIEHRVVEGWGKRWIRWIDTEWQEVEV